MNSSEALSCLERLIQDSGREGLAPESVLLSADGFGEFVWLVSGTDVALGVVSLSVIIGSAPKGFGNGVSCRQSVIVSLVGFIVF